MPRRWASLAHWARIGHEESVVGVLGVVIGPLGVILARPLTLFATALLVDIDSSTRWVGALLSTTMPDDEGPAAGKHAG